jgi:beta-glucanase (GH16 family)
MPNHLRWLIDGVERKVMTEHVPSKAMYLILNTAVGGDWGGAPDKTTVFPQYFTIDYVRIFQHHRD